MMLTFWSQGALHKRRRTRCIPSVPRVAPPYVSRCGSACGSRVTQCVRDCSAAGSAGVLSIAGAEYSPRAGCCCGWPCCSPWCMGDVSTHGSVEAGALMHSAGCPNALLFCGRRPRALVEWITSVLRAIQRVSRCPRRRPSPYCPFCANQQLADTSLITQQFLDCCSENPVSCSYVARMLYIVALLAAPADVVPQAWPATLAAGLPRCDTTLQGHLNRVDM